MEYKVEKGSFSSGIHLGVHFGRVKQTYKVTFDSSSLYDDTLDWERDWNKLVGWSYSNLPYYYKDEKKWQAPHHNNSVRLASRANKVKGVQELAFYFYQDGVRNIIELCNVPVEKELLLTISLNKEFVTIVVVCKETNLSFIKSVTLPHAFKAIWSYKLYPYFGGSNPAWQDYKVEVTEI